MLYNKRKFHLRTYFLIAIINGKYKTYFYELYELFTAAKPYNNNDYTDTDVHDTHFKSSYRSDLIFPDDLYGETTPMITDKDIDIIRRTNLKKLYYYLAIQGKQKIYKNAIKSQLKINPHPLEKYRVNCPLSRLPLFKAIHDIKKGDGMYWKDNTSIWS